MKNLLLNHQLRRLNNLIWAWSIASESHRDSTRLVEHIIEQYLVTKIFLRDDHLNWSYRKTQKFKESELLEALSWATLEPIVELAKMGESHLKNNEFEKAREVFRELQNQPAMISKIKARIGKSTRTPHPIDILIKEILKTNSNITLPNLKKELKKQEGGKVIFLWDEDENEILCSDIDGNPVRAITISGLKDRFHEIKKLK